MNLNPGTIIDDRFVVLEVLGHGGMGSVYRARQVGLERVVAVKLLQAGYAGDSESRSRFEREGRILSMLTHAGLPLFYHFGVWNSVPYIAMEFVPGNSLHDELATGAMPWRRAVGLAIQVCAALSVVHKNGCVHRDIKPGNIMVLENDIVKIVDFGLALLPETELQKLTHTGNLVGSVYYMSPEQCKGRRVDHRTDIYSLACVVFECVAGKPPLVAHNAIGLMHLHVHGEIPRVGSIAGDQVPDDLNSVLQRALAKDPDKRYQSIDELQQHLELILNNQKLPIGFERSKPQTRLRPASLVALAALLVVSLWMAGGALRAPRTEHPSVSTLAVGPWNEKLHDALAATGVRRITLCEELREELRNQGSTGIPAANIWLVYSMLVAPLMSSRGNENQAVELLQQAIEELEKRRDPQPLADALIQYGQTLFMLSDLDGAQHQFRRVVEMRLKLRNSRCVPLAYRELSACAEGRSNFVQAENCMMAAIQAYVRLKMYDDARQCMMNLPLMACSHGDDKAFGSYRIAVKEFFSQAFMFGEMDSYIKICSDLSDLGFMRQALSIVQDCHQVCATLAPEQQQVVATEIVCTEAKVLADMKNFAAAEAVVVEALHKHESPALRARLACLLVHQGRHGESEASYLRALRDAPPRDKSVTPVLWGLAELYDEIGQPKKSLHYFDRLLSSGVPSVSLLNWQHTTVDRLLRKNRPDLAKSLIDRIVRALKKRNETTLLAVAELSYASLPGSVCAAEAEAGARDAVGIVCDGKGATSDQQTNACITLGSLLLQKCRFAEAESYFRKALDYDHSRARNDACRRYLLDVLVKEGKNDDAEKVARDLLKTACLDVQGLKAANWVAEFQVQQNHLADAQAILDRFQSVANRMTPHRYYQADLLCDLEYTRGQLYYRRREYDKALQHVRESLRVSESKKDNLEASLLMADSLLKVGKTAEYTQCVADLRKRFVSKREVVDCRIALLEYGRGNRDEARSLMNEVLRRAETGGCAPVSRLAFYQAAADVCSGDREKQAALLSMVRALHHRYAELRVDDLEKRLKP